MPKPLKESHREIERIRKELRLGMSLNELIELLGPPSGSLGGKDVFRTTQNIGADISGSGTAVKQMADKQYVEWERPEGRYRLVIAGDKLVNIYSAPEEVTKNNS